MVEMLTGRTINLPLTAVTILAGTSGGGGGGGGVI